MLVAQGEDDDFPAKPGRMQHGRFVADSASGALQRSRPA